MNILRVRRASCAAAFVLLAACGAPAPGVAEVRGLLDSTSTFKDASLRVDTLKQDSPEAFSGEAVAPDGTRRKIFAGVRDGLLHYQVKRTVAASAPGASEASEDVQFGTIPLGR
jgi:hypothetical protein